MPSGPGGPAYSAKSLACFVCSLVLPHRLHHAQGPVIPLPLQRHRIVVVEPRGNLQHLSHAFSLMGRVVVQLISYSYSLGLQCLHKKTTFQSGTLVSSLMMHKSGETMGSDGRTCAEGPKAISESSLAPAL
jgi:hypothetical protein